MKSYLLRDYFQEQYCSYPGLQPPEMNGFMFFKSYPRVLFHCLPGLSDACGDRG